MSSKGNPLGQQPPSMAMSAPANRAALNQPAQPLMTNPVAALNQSPAEVIAASDADSRRRGHPVSNSQGKVIAQTESAEEAEFLREIVVQSQRHGKDIEAAIEYLSDLLRKKNVECEGLRSLAQENYDPVRRAVRREYDARVQSESRQQLQLRQLMTRIEELHAERQTLQQEVNSLKTLISELERKPPPSSYSEFDGSLFNRVVYDPKNDDFAEPGGAAGAALRAKKESDNPSSSWSLAQGGSVLNAPKNQTQRDVLAGLSGIDSDVAKALEQAQVFDLMKAVLVRMCTKLPTGTFPDLTTVITALLRERRNDPTSLARSAAQPVPVAEVSDRQRVTQLFLANNPGQLQELEMLLAQNVGKEADLYEQLRERFYSEDGRMRVAGNLRNNAPIISSTSDNLRPTAVSGDPTTELSARCMLMYKKYNPSKLLSKELNVLLGKYPPQILLSALIEKYGPEPSAAEKRELLRSLVEPTAM